MLMVIARGGVRMEIMSIIKEVLKEADASKLQNNGCGQFNLESAASDPLRKYLMGLDKEVLLELLICMYIGRDIATKQYDSTNMNMMKDGIIHIIKTFRDESKSVIAGQIAEKRMRLHEYFNICSSHMAEYEVARGMIPEMQ